VLEKSGLNFNNSTFAMMALEQGSGDDHQIRYEDAPADPALETIGSVGRAMPQLDGALHHADATFDSVAKAQTFFEPVLFFIGGALGRARSGLWDSDLLNAQVASQAFIVWGEEAAVTRQHTRSMTEAFAMLSQQRSNISASGASPRR
jgi:hypothetical protein